ncbi:MULTISPECIES: restriction endonuclease subunit S [Porphyromonas]|jgi:hypothetical protein|uniref:Type I restriction modification DNA specificity domain-containing protein n=1 Tax=Porphyromonas pasteri TaxID=1583331 RepID=A0ABQ2H927_9PORP|nr:MULTISPECIES: restriction endonuclease subunit S [Porphyromonas]GGM55701.1 hypothetical protein GCM10007088_13160 [Porphyromonas pasteri]
MVEDKELKELLPPLRWYTLAKEQVISNGYRLDASAYDIGAMDALSRVHHNPYGWVYLWSKKGLVEDAYVGGRFKRIYTENKNDIPFFLPSDIENVYPSPSKYISAKTVAPLDDLRVNKGMLLVSVSGTIGKTSLVSKKMDKQVFSHDLLRVTFQGSYDLGYVYAYLNTEVGLKLLQSNNYGAVIDHIEPIHLMRLPIPNAPEEIKRSIHEAVVASYDLRDQSNDLIDEAQRLLYDALGLSAKMELTPQYYTPDAGFRCFTVKHEELNNRFDASYHVPEVKEILFLIAQNAAEVTTLGDPRVSKEIILPGRFKRIYVEKGKGVPFFGGKQLLQLDPSGDKYLSLNNHGDRIDQELSIKKNMCLVSCSGTIGKVQIAPRHWNGWAINQHVMRVIPASDEIAGYIYSWLSSPYCFPLIVRNNYGAVIDEIDDKQLAEVSIPLLTDKAVQSRINNLVLEANALRYKAYLKEQDALQQMEKVLRR